MQGATADQWKQQEFWSVLAAGMPKGAGKTTLALSAPQPTIVVACDLGRISIPPGVDRSKVLVLPYQDLTRVMEESGTTKPKRDIYVKLTKDLFNIYTSVKAQNAIKLEDGKEFPPPATIVLDGVSRLNNMLVDGLCAMNNIDEPTFAVGDKGKAFAFWGKRLRSILTIVEQFASLPCNVVLTTWVDQQKDSEGKPTNVWLPDVGGKMDIVASGTVGAALYLFSRMGKFYARTKPDGMYNWCGVRDKYDLKEEIDITIEKGQPSPWERIFGGGK
jgi:hypothetical protein